MALSNPLNVQTSSTNTLSYTPPSDGLLVVCASIEDVSNDATQPATCDWGASAMTLAVSRRSSLTFSSYNYVYIWIFEGCGTSNLTITVNDGGETVGICAFTITGAKTSPADDTDTDFNTGGAVSMTVTPTATNSIVISARADGQNSATPLGGETGGSGTTIGNIAIASTAMLGVAYEQRTDTSAVNHTYDGSVRTAGAAVVLLEDTGGGGVTIPVIYHHFQQQGMS